MNLHDLGWARVRLLLLPLTALLVAAAAAPAQADYVSFDEGASDERYQYLEPGDKIDLDARLALFPEAPFHAMAGSSFTLQAANVPAGATVGSPRLDVFSPWPNPSTPDRPSTQAAVSLTAPNSLGESKFNVNWTPAGVQCAAGTSCVRAPAPVQYTLNVIPRPATNIDITEIGEGARVTWTPSADDHRITGYNVIRVEKGNSRNRRTWNELPRGTSSVHDAGPLKPGTEYCWSIGVYYINDTSRVGSSSYRQELCETMNAAPTTPGPATGPAADPDGDFGVSWTPSTDPDGDAFRYELQTRDANDADWRTLASNLTQPSYDARAFAEGTWRFRVRAVGPDAAHSSGWNEAGAPVKVDKSQPSIPTASTREPDYFGWFKDEVSVSWTGSADPMLLDGSPGSGVVAYSPAETFTNTGQSRARGRARDAAGNESGERSHFVLVDSDSPQVSITCPSQPVLVGDDIYAQWRADDQGVGMDETGGGVKLDTSSRGEREAVAPVVTDFVGHDSNVARCTYVVKAAPTAPGGPTGPAFDRDGSFELAWDPSTDEDGDPFTYHLVGRRGAEPYAFLKTGLTEPAYTTENLAEGTWDFAVRAFESNLVGSSYTERQDVTKVDRTPPSAPGATTDPAAPADEDGGWFKDRVTVAFGGSTDPDLADGTTGSGVAGYSDAQTFGTTGDHTATGTATDRAGNRSAETTRAVKVDATAPVVEITCPRGPLPVGSTHSASWEASDEGSGLATPAAGSEALDTSSAGKKTITSPAPRDKVGHEGATDSCDYEVNAPPAKPGTPAGPEFDRDGTFELTWAESADADGDNVTYAVEQRESGDAADWQPLSDGLTAAGLRVTDTREGTYDYRVRAFDPHGGVSEWAEANDVVKVDGTAPTAPTATTDPAAPADGAGGWFKDAVTVSFGGSTDPGLRDGSAGSGVASTTEAKTFDSSGSHSITGRSADRAGNESGATPVDVKVDATAPVVDIDGCPTEPVLEGTRKVVSWSAEDEHSGLTGEDSGELTLDTRTPGEDRVAEVTVADRVGHETVARCEFDVYANTPPSTPADITVPDPALDPDGRFTVSWSAASDRDTSAGDSLRYELARQDANDGDDWTTVDGADELRRTIEVGDGTWTFRVRAVDSFGAASAWTVSGPVKVDTTAPSAPKATTDPAAAGDSGWFKDAVSVSFGGSADPGAEDGSEGSGVDRYEGDRRFTESGTHSASGTAIDRAGHRSAATEVEVKVDVTPPRLDFVEGEGCPTEPLLEGSKRVVAWKASDAHSGLATEASGSATLDTATPGDNRVATITARDQAGHVTTIECEFDVYANTPPAAPGAPQGPSIDQDGEFALTWAPASDRDSDAGDSFTYELQRQDADDVDWTKVAGDLTQARRDVTVENGTWRFRVRAVDGFGAASDWVASAPIKVDGVKPTAPEAITDPAAAQNGWFKNRVTVSFAGSQDPALPDSSDGSGIASYTAPKSFETTGEHVAEGAATDRAGNVSDVARRTVRVDADPPAVAITCPTAPLIAGQTAKATWTATDRGSGLTTAASGAVTLDTSSPGDRTATAPAARDAAGHETKGVSCSYEVAYKFAGFNAPINGSVVNAGKAGRTYPVKWRLQRHDGALISDSAALSLLPTMSVITRATDCGSFGALPEDALGESTTLNPSLKYDSSGNQFHYNYKTPSSPGCYVLVVRNADGNSTRWVNFKLTK